MMETSGELSQVRALINMKMKNGYFSTLRMDSLIII